MAYYYFIVNFLATFYVNLSVSVKKCHKKLFLLKQDELFSIKNLSKLQGREGGYSYLLICPKYFCPNLGGGKRGEGGGAALIWTMFSNHLFIYSDVNPNLINT